MPCDTCNRDGLGLFEGIRLTLVCAPCCSTAVSEDGHPIICYSKARALFHVIPPKRVETLGSTPRRNPHYRNAAPMRMYALKELIVLQRKVEHELSVKTERLQKERLARLERLLRVHKISPASSMIHSALFEHTFGDYLSTKKPKKKLKELKYTFGAHDISVQLCPRDPVCAMNFLERRGITTFNLEQLQTDFDYSLFLSDRVFRLEGLSIARFICPAQLAQLKHGPLAEVPAAVERLRKNAIRMLRMSLQHLGFEKTEIGRMMDCKAMKIRVRRCVKYVHEPGEVAKNMADFWLTRNNPEHRRQLLQTAMGEKGVWIRDDSVYCHDFIHGEIDVDLDEIVGIQYITRELFEDGGPRLWSRAHDACESAFRKSLLENGNDLDTSIRVALRSASRGRKW